MTKKTTVSLEEAFAIGRPARTSAYKTCSRCKGTGWWQLFRKCFKCGGCGHAEVSTVATQIRDKRKHIAEVRAALETNRACLAEKLAAGRPRWTWMSIEDWIARDQENLLKLEGDLAALEARVSS